MDPHILLGSVHIEDVQMWSLALHKIRCQGIGNQDTVRTLKEMLAHHKTEILILLQTRISEEKADKVCCGLLFQQWVRVECVGFSGGIWMF